MDPIVYDSFAALPHSHILDVGEQTRARYPEAWANAHNGDPDSGTEFVRRWADACRTAGIYAGNNGKRGSLDPSQDVLDFPVRSGGAHDTSGRFDQICICDCIGGAGGPNPTLGLNDVSAASQGRFLDPWGLEPGNGEPDPGPGPSPVPPTPTPTPPYDDTALRVALTQIDAKLNVVLARLDAAADQQAADTNQIGRWMVEQAQGVVQAVVGQLGPRIDATLCRFKR